MLKRLRGPGVLSRFANVPADIPLTQPCKNCHGTGTVFRGKTLRINSTKCPVCKGSCRVPYESKQP